MRASPLAARRSGSSSGASAAGVAQPRAAVHQVQKPIRRASCDVAWQSPRRAAPLAAAAASGAAGAAADGGGDAAGPPPTPPGCSRYTVELRRPLGIVMEQKGKDGGIFVVSITPGGNADKTGEFSEGDQLISTSGVTYTKTDDYGGVTVKKGQEIVQMSALGGATMKQVSAAIGSHPASIPVKLTFQRCAQ